MGLISVEARLAHCQLFHLVSAHPSTAVWELKGVGSLMLFENLISSTFRALGRLLRHLCSFSCCLLLPLPCSFVNYSSDLVNRFTQLFAHSIPNSLISWCMFMMYVCNLSISFCMLALFFPSLLKVISELCMLLREQKPSSSKLQ